MSVYSIKQKMLTFGDDFSIRNEKGDDAYYVNSRLLTFGANLTIYNMQRKPEAKIRQRLLSFRPTYDIYCEDVVVATVTKSIMTIRPQFSVETVAGEKMKVVGNFIFYDYHFYRGTTPVAEVSKKIISFTDSYGVKVVDGEDDLLILCSAIVIDMALHGKKKKK